VDGVVDGNGEDDEVLDGFVGEGGVRDGIRKRETRRECGVRERRNQCEAAVAEGAIAGAMRRGERNAVRVWGNQGECGGRGRNAGGVWVGGCVWV